METGAHTAHQDEELRGRDRELEAIRRLLAAAGAGSGKSVVTGPNVLVLTGDPGVGKTALVTRSGAEAGARGWRVLRARGSEREHDLAFAGVHQLLRPVLTAVDGLPPRQRDALRSAFGTAADDGREPPDPLMIRMGVLTMLSDVAAVRPLFVTVDDAQWLDVGSLDVLAFVARRLEGERIALLITAREEAVPTRFDRDFAHLTVGPLDRVAAGLLLDAQPYRPRGRVRTLVLEQAAGNPLALVELARVSAASTAGGGFESLGVLPLTERLERLFAAGLPLLPEATRRALLLAAAAGTDTPVEAWQATRLADDDARVWLPAEEAGLVRVESGRVRVRHPLVRSAVYQSASFTDRRTAHLALAKAHAGEPDRRAWHLAAAAPGPDEDVAAALAESAERHRRRGGYGAAAKALERAADLTPDTGRRAGRLLSAASYAMLAGHPQWVGEITGRVGRLTDDARTRSEAELLGGWSLAVTLRHDDSLGLLLRVAETMAAVEPELALNALSTGATPAYGSGDPFHRAELRRIGRLIPPQPDHSGGLWSRLVADPFAEREAAVGRLNGLVDALREDSLPDAVVLGLCAWILDETGTAVRLLGRARDHHRRAATAGTNCGVAQSLALALFESGAWTAAETAAADALCMAREAGADNVAVGAPVLQATLRAVRGDHAGARSRAADAVRGVDLRGSRGLYVRHCHALGLAAVASGDHRAAYEHLRRVFTRDFRPAPVHHHASYYCLADLAAAAVRAGRQDDARAVLDAARASLGRPGSARLTSVVHRAAALLSGSGEAEPHFRASLADPKASRWPFEHALAQLDFGEWLRRHRRSAEARPFLATALEIFERLDARPWTERATSELRAAGVSVADAVPLPAAAELTPQELRIARLAAEGLTNRDIAVRLYLSPRTVGFHLGKVFPKLGVTGRAQLRDVLDRLPRRS
ncbi:transcriptional regulator [Streptomyces inusitatus]|uniref:Transcriptional regulator n=1 Tax=Streptomyces inusitatus TaxID=68221 RepID=A0A918V0R5_9ACTN|nr:LuxR family transcriptional regulator [Streptomyces inusitatus]GGZ51239.1 transcriptional regulator [Streptomyces inusitatus]